MGDELAPQSLAAPRTLETQVCNRTATTDAEREDQALVDRSKEGGSTKRWDG
jgi:hypothetical protein